MLHMQQVITGTNDGQGHWVDALLGFNVLKPGLVYRQLRQFL